MLDMLDPAAGRTCPVRGQLLCFRSRYAETGMRPMHHARKSYEGSLTDGCYYSLRSEEQGVRSRHSEFRGTVKTAVPATSVVR